ncbi:hypothetical protein [Desulfocurvus sp. DL9XJH121]
MGPRVLILAPDDGFRSQLAFRLAAAGIVVDEEADTGEAVRFLTDRGADVILFLARECGDEDLGRIRRLADAAPKAGIILLESGGDVDFAMRARSQGVLDDMLVPFDVNELLHKIQGAGKRPAKRS